MILLLVTFDALTCGQGKFTIIKDCAKIADNTIIPPNTVVPALALFAGSPGRPTQVPNRILLTG
jgi:hypothetical protein